MSYDAIAPFYDGLSKVVFGSSLTKAKTCFLQELKPGDKVLAVGGGTGDILAYLPKGVRAHFIDTSPKMLQIARDRSATHEFAQASVFDITDRTYDVILLHCFVDQFSATDLDRLIDHVQLLLAPNGCVQVTEFVDEKLWHKALLTMMYGFFRYTTNLQNNRLPAWKDKFRSKFHAETTKRYYGGFIHAIWYTQM